MDRVSQFQDWFGLALDGRDAGLDPALQRALRIHRNTSAKAAQDALADNFPVVRALVGDDAFMAAAASFAAVLPPDEPRLCVYGSGFPAFLQVYPAFAAVPYVADVARLEQLVVTALFAADAEPAGADLALAMEQPLRLHPAVAWAQFNSPAASLWLAHQEDATPDALDQLDWAAETVVVTRPFGAVIVANVPRAAAAFLQQCANGAALQDAAQACGDQLGEVFATLVALGCFVES